MDQQEIDRWEDYYRECAARDFERRIYDQIDEEELFTIGEEKAYGER